MAAWISHFKVFCEAWLYVTVILTFVVLPERGLVTGFQFENVTVPETGLRGGSETLRCDFQLGSDTLYSLKWYKDEKEFFRFVTANNRLSPIQFSLPGVNVALKKSNLHQVTLTNLSIESSGTYRCEISAENTFRTIHKEGNLTVIVPPEREKPTISNVSNMYHMGDTINGNCTAFRSRPAANLTFQVHGTKVDSNSLIQYEPVNETGGLQTAILGLRFVVAHDHFQRGVLKLKCVASIGKRRWSEERVIEHRNFYSPVASVGQRGYSSGSTRTCAQLEPVVWIYSLLSFLSSFAFQRIMLMSASTPTSTRRASFPHNPVHPSSPVPLPPILALTTCINVHRHLYSSP